MSSRAPSARVGQGLRSLIIAVVLAVSVLVLIPSSVEAVPTLSQPGLGSLTSPQRPFFVILFWIAAFVLIAAQGALIVAVLRLSRRKDRPAWFRLDSRILEAAWTLLPLLLLLGLLLLSWPALREG